MIECLDSHYVFFYSCMICFTVVLLLNQLLFLYGELKLFQDKVLLLLLHAISYILS